MKTELEKKLNKLPAYIDDIDGNRFMLSIIKCDFEKNPNNWQIDYMDIYKNTILSVTHSSLQAAVDTTLKEIKNL